MQLYYLSLYLLEFIVSNVGGGRLLSYCCEESTSLVTIPLRLDYIGKVEDGGSKHYLLSFYLNLYGRLSLV